MDRRLESAYLTLRVGLGAIAVVAGLDKFFNLLTFWPHYVAAPFAKLMPITPQLFMYIVGVIEVIVGVAILAKWSRYFGYVLMVWMWCIAIDLIAARLFDIAARDVAISLGAFALAKLSEVHDRVPLTTGRPVPTRPIAAH
jgi:uncharacterized membrane protein YphA (DoxX/SURF4 family)